MQTVELRSELREAVGKSALHQLRREGKTPGILYGKGEENVAISVNSHDFKAMLRKQGAGTFVIDLTIAGRNEPELKTIIKELQRDPVTSMVLHIDLQHVSMTQVIHVKVPIHLTGTPLGVKEGGILDQLCRELDVECRASEIPEAIEVDVSALSKGDTIHLSDITIPEKVRSLTPPDRVIASVIVKAVEEKPAVEEVDEEAAKEEGAKEETDAASADAEAKS